MNSTKRITRLAIGALLLLAVAGPAFAQATRTWVSGVGDDANPCSRTAPCKTWAGAISKTAVGGEINAIDPGGFGAVTITKSITIDGGESQSSILAAGTNGINVNGAGIVVTLRNLSINGAGTGLHGISVTNAASVNLDNLQIFGFTNSGINFVPTATAELFIKDTSIFRAVGASHGGIVIKPTVSGSASVTLENVRSENNSFGLVVQSRTVVNARNSVFAGNFNDGVLTAPEASQNGFIFLDTCLVSGNGANASTAGVRAVGLGGVVRLSNNTITDNTVGVLAQNTASMLSFGNNRIDGNTNNGSVTGSIIPQQ